MRIKSWKMVAIGFVCLSLVGFGYSLNSWVRPASVKAQDAAVVQAPQSRFQLMFLPTPFVHGDAADRGWLLDMATGKVFWLGDLKNYNGHETVLKQVPIESCADAECVKTIGTIDAR